MSDTSTSPFVRSTRQQRSEATVRRILAAATELFESGTLEATPVADVAARAGVSVGGLYRRFRSKQDLLRAVAEAQMQRIARRVERLLSESRLADAGAAEVVTRFARALVASMGGRDRAVVRRLSLLVRGDADLPASRAIRAGNAQVHDLFARALLARRAEILHPEPERAIEFADLAMSAAAREALLHDGLTRRVDRDELVAELTALGRSYLQIEGNPRSR